MSSLAQFNQGVQINQLAGAANTAPVLTIADKNAKSVAQITNQITSLTQTLDNNLFSETLVLNSVAGSANLTVNSVDGDVTAPLAGVLLTNNSVTISADFDGAGQPNSGISLDAVGLSILSKQTTPLTIEQAGGSSSIVFSGAVGASVLDISSVSADGGLTQIRGDVDFLSINPAAKDTVDFTAVNVVGIITGTANVTQYTVGTVGAPLAYNTATVFGTLAPVNINGSVVITIDGTFVNTGAEQNTAAASAMFLATKSIGNNAIINTIATVPGANTGAPGETFSMAWNAAGVLTVTINLNGGTATGGYIARIMVTHNSNSNADWTPA